MQSSQGGWEFLIFIFSLLAIMVTNTAFRNLVYEMFFGHIIQSCYYSAYIFIYLSISIYLYIIYIYIYIHIYIYIYI